MTDPTTTALLRQLDQRIRALENRPAPGAEALTPSYITVTAAGRVGANFTGFVHALGLLLDAGAGAQHTATNSIQWHRTSDGALIADLYAYEFPQNDDVLLSAYNATGNQASAQMRAVDNGGGVSAVTSVITPAHDANTNTQVQAANVLATLLDGIGQSSFLQLLSSQKLRLAFGTGACPLTNGSSVGATQTIAHGLGSAPRSVWAFPRATGSVGANPYTMAFGEANPPDATNIYINCDNVDGFTAWAAGNQASFYWFALG